MKRGRPKRQREAMYYSSSHAEELEGPYFVILMICFGFFLFFVPLPLSLGSYVGEGYEGRNASIFATFCNLQRVDKFVTNGHCLWGWKRIYSFFFASSESLSSIDGQCWLD
jgi:hypothetical protein